MKQHFWRYIFPAGLLTSFAVVIVIRLLWLQLDPTINGNVSEQEQYYQSESHTVYPARGLIYDRWGNLLAGNTAVDEVGVDLPSMRYAKNSHTIALTLNVVLGLDYNKVKTDLDSASDQQRYVVLDDYVPQEKIERITQYAEEMKKMYAGAKDAPSLAGLQFTQKLQRTYPQNATGSNMVGFVGKDEHGNNVGQFGVEAYYDGILGGLPIKVKMPTNPSDVVELPKVPEGTSLILTIDLELQRAVEQIADAAIHETGAVAATILVLDPKTGEILAMANTPRMDLNRYWHYGDVFQNGTQFNRAVSQEYEPGSVYKVLTMASALDSHTVTPNTKFLDRGVIEVGGAVIHNWNGGAWGPQDMEGCMQHSLNVCLAWVATKVGAGTFYSYMKSFGIGHTTGVDLASEAWGRLKLPGDSDWYESDLGVNAFGQGVAVTPLQLASAISAVANEGKMMAPHIVRSMITNGRQYDVEPRVIGMPISASTAFTLTNMLATSLEKEASSALVDGYRVAGKTGTAEIPTPYGYTSGVTNASFVGWGPVKDPRFLVYIWLEKPQSSIWGSEVAAPIFPKVVDRVVVMLNIPPDDVRKSVNGQ